MVEGSGLENRRYESIRGFESHSLRQKEMHPLWVHFFLGMDVCRVGFERRLLAGCRWHAATNLAFPQKRNPTNDADDLSRTGIQNIEKRIILYKKYE